MSASRRLRKYVITTGDADGIGLEVTYKALLKLSIPKHFEFTVLEPKKIHRSLRSLRKRLAKKRGIRLAPSAASPARWVFDAAKMCSQKKYSALITAPLSKTLIRDAGYSQIGHTEILATVCRSKNLHMCFLGNEFNVVLATAHVPLARVAKALRLKNLVTATTQAQAIRKKLPQPWRSKPIALVGLNPHAGEDGLLGHEEKRVFRSALSYLKRKKIHAIGPLVPDAAFLRANWRKYSIFVCAYHDQGLIPFKLVHGSNSGAHLTLGLPFVRTSVDHGTAKRSSAKTSPTLTRCTMLFAGPSL